MGTRSHQCIPHHGDIEGGFPTKSIAAARPPQPGHTTSGPAAGPGPRPGGCGAVRGVSCCCSAALFACVTRAHFCLYYCLSLLRVQLSFTCLWHVFIFALLSSFLRVPAGGGEAVLCGAVRGSG